MGKRGKGRQYHRLRVFVALPGDVREECERLARVLVSWRGGSLCSQG
jgi:hypothetical protein